MFFFYQVRLLLSAGFTYNTCSGKPFARLHHSACKSQRTVLQPSGAIESFSYVVVTLRVASKILLGKKSIRERVSWTFRRNAQIDFILFAMGITHLCILVSVRHSRDRKYSPADQVWTYVKKRCAMKLIKDWPKMWLCLASFSHQLLVFFPASCNQCNVRNLLWLEIFCARPLRLCLKVSWSLLCWLVWFFFPFRLTRLTLPWSI